MEKRKSHERFRDFFRSNKKKKKKRGFFVIYLFQMKLARYAVVMANSCLLSWHGSSR